MKKLWVTVLFILSIFYSSQVFATCARTGVSQTEDGRSALINFGTVNLASAYLEPVGTLLASTVVPPTNYTYGGANADSVLWVCDTADLPNIQFLVATNGDDRVGGYWDLGAADGMPNVYATYFQYVGLRQSMAGVTITRFWQAIPVTSYAVVKGKINIRLKDIPPLYAELYRLSQLAPQRGSGSYYCGSGASGQISSGSYSCTQPNAYIQLHGPGIRGDQPGEDSNDHHQFWGVDNGFGYGMRGNTLRSIATCVARSATPLVSFNTIGISDLNNNLGRQANFNVAIECNNTVTSGVNTGQTAIGFQVSAGALSAAQNLGLVNNTSGVSALLSDHYGRDGIAKGVGIYLSNANTRENMIFVGAQNANSGAASGWYPVLSGVNGQGIASSQAGYTHYTHTFTATLKKLEGVDEKVEPGQVKSTAYVLVRVQ
jgi:type 1 fimbria pilin